MKCDACGSEEQRVMSTRPTPSKIVRLRCCSACGHRWTTTEIATDQLSMMESAVNTVRSFASLTKELNAAAPHG